MLFARVAFRDPQATNSQDHAVRIDGRPARTMRFPHLSGTSGGQAFATAMVDASTIRTTVDVGIATGPFVEVERMSPGDAVPTVAADAPSDVPMRIESLEAGRGELIVRLKVSPPSATFDDRSWLLQAFCRDGRVLGPAGYRETGPAAGTARIRVDPKDVAYVAYRTRPYVWHRLGEVDVPPMTTMPRPPGWRAPATRPTPPPSPEVERRMRERRAAQSAATRPG